MKSIAILDYEIMFDPSEAWSNGYQFENQLADFFGAYGFEAHIIEARGGTGKRVIWLEKVGVPAPKVSTTQKPVKKIQPQVAPKFREYQTRGVPRSIVNQEKRAPKLGFQNYGSSNRQKVKMP